MNSYIKFTVTGGSGPAKAVLRLFPEATNTTGGTVVATTNDWTESGITAANAPAAGMTLARIGAITAGVPIDVDLGDIITGPGTYSLAIISGNDTLSRFTSREGANPPRLTVTSTGSDGGPPTAAFSATPTSGTAPLQVAFNNTTTGQASGWAWDFGDGGTSTAQNPTHTYMTPGTYTVTLTATGTGGSDGETKAGLVTVSPPPTSSPSATITADAYTSASEPATNFGSVVNLRVRTSTTTLNSYLKFEVTGVTGPADATLRLWAETSNSAGGGTVVAVSNNWTESAITAGNAPLAGTTLATLPATTAGVPVDVNLGRFINGPGTYSIAIINGNGTLSRFSSRETTNPPQLLIRAAPQ